MVSCPPSTSAPRSTSMPNVANIDAAPSSSAPTLGRRSPGTAASRQNRATREARIRSRTHSGWDRHRAREPTPVSECLTRRRSRSGLRRCPEGWGRPSLPPPPPPALPSRRPFRPGANRQRRGRNRVARPSSFDACVARAAATPPATRTIGPAGRATLEGRLVTGVSTLTSGASSDVCTLASSTFVGMRDQHARAPSSSALMRRPGPTARGRTRRPRRLTAHRTDLMPHHTQPIRRLEQISHRQKRALARLIARWSIVRLRVIVVRRIGRSPSASHHGRPIPRMATFGG